MEIQIQDEMPHLAASPDAVCKSGSGLISRVLEVETLDDPPNIPLVLGGVPLKYVLQVQTQLLVCSAR